MRRTTRIWHWDYRHYYCDDSGSNEYGDVVMASGDDEEDVVKQCDDDEHEHVHDVNREQ